jgi:hypothetical protein
VEFIVAVVVSNPEVTRMAYFSVIELLDVPTAIYRKHLGPVIDGIAQLLQMCIDRKVIRNIEPYLAIFGIIGGIVAHQHFLTLVTGKPLPHDEKEGAVRAYTEAWTDMLLGSAAIETFAVARSNDAVASVQAD